MSDVTYIVVSVKAGEDWRKMAFEGRDAWTLARLIEAGERGVTPIERPAPRWSGYVHRLRQTGLSIETIREPHSGTYPGQHARYVLRTPVRVVREVAA